MVRSMVTLARLSCSVVEIGIIVRHVTSSSMKRIFAEVLAIVLSQT